MQARRSSLYRRNIPDILFYDDFSIANVDGQNLTDRTPVGTDALAGTSYAKMVESHLDSVTFGTEDVRPNAGNNHQEFNSTELLPAPGLEWGTEYHAIQTTFRVGVHAAMVGVGMWNSDRGSNPKAPQTADGIFIQAYDRLGVLEISVRVRDNKADTHPSDVIKKFSNSNQDVKVRLEAEIIGNSIHFAAAVNNTLIKEVTTPLNSAKTNTRIMLYVRKIAGNPNSSRIRHSIQVDTNRNFLP
jgi:hypothetical protein